MANIHNVITTDVIQHTQNQYYDHILKICYPLFKKSPVRYFDYTRYYDSGEMVTLRTYPDFTAKYIRERLYPTFQELEMFRSFGQRMTILSHNLPLPPGAKDLNPDKYQENIAKAADARVYDRLYFVDRKEDFYRTCGFGVNSADISSLNYYLNSLSTLEKFIKYFEHHGQDLIKENSQRNRILLPNFCDQSTLKNIELESPKKTIPHSNSDRLLTMRELDCLRLTAQGYTMKCTARQLDISPRTVEQHLRHVKEKHGINTKNQLVEIWHDNYS